MSLFVPTWHTEKRGQIALPSNPVNPEKPFPPLSGEESQGICPRFSWQDTSVHPCVGCEAETKPADMFCSACWEKRLTRMPRDVAERRRRLERVRLSTSPQAARSAHSGTPARPPNA